MIKSVLTVSFQQANPIGSEGSRLEETHYHDSFTETCELTQLSFA